MVYYCKKTIATIRNENLLLNQNYVSTFFFKKKCLLEIWQKTLNKNLLFLFACRYDVIPIFLKKSKCGVFFFHAKEKIKST